jgi:LPS sulfotransferase NodH
MSEAQAEPIAETGAQTTQPGAQRATACIICTAPRTGSSLLAEALAATGCLGVPAEYFDIHEKNKSYWMQRLGIAESADYLEKVIAAGSTANGVFGLKIHWHQIPALLRAFAAMAGTDLAQASKRPLDVWLKSRFANCHYLWLRRRNKVAQGISYYRATLSDVWRVRAGAKSGPVAAGRAVPFDFAEIDRHVRLVEDFDRRWLEFFNARKLRTLVLVYEDLIGDYERTIRGVCRFAGLAADQIVIGPKRLEKQADEVSLEWEQQYRRMKESGERVAPVPARRRQARVTGGSRAATVPAASPTLRPENDDAVNVASLEPALNAGRLIAYDMNPQLGVRLVTPSSKRAWMDATPQRFAYRCLPLVIANQHGWLLLNPCRIQAIWTGETPIESLTIEYPPDQPLHAASSHFGSGVLTFSMNYIFRTPPGVNLLVRGPANMPKDGICALEGIIETDWAESTFTMNWKMTRPNHPVMFEKDEPFAMITPIGRDEIEHYLPEIYPLAANPTLEAGYKIWAQSRSAFNKELKTKGSDAQKMRWQRHYVRGETVGEKKALDHRTQVAIKEFVDRRK